MLYRISWTATRRPGVRFPVGTVYLPIFTSFARDSKWGVPSLNDLAVAKTLNTNEQSSEFMKLRFIEQTLKYMKADLNKDETMGQHLPNIEYRICLTLVQLIGFILYRRNKNTP